jgi:hypothetical protein
MKHLKTTSKTHLKQTHGAATVQWRGRMVTGKRLGVVKNAAPEQSLWTTPCWLEELGCEW